MLRLAAIAFVLLGLNSQAQSNIFADGHPDLIPTGVQPAPVAPNSWRGILRINCDFSHAAYDDPLVHPGNPGAAHYHNFYGFFDTDAFTRSEALYADLPTGQRVSSCQGNQLNRSAYWVPALLAPLYDDSGVRQLDAAGEPAWQVVDAVVGNDEVAHEVFYYSAAVDDLSAISAPPPGLAIIAGVAGTQPGSPQPSSVARWHCQSWNASDAGNPDFRGFIPECVAPDRLRFDLFFPSCWNGVDLDSPDHHSHMAYPETVAGVSRCPASHPVALPRVSYHYAFGVRPENADPQTRSSRGWRLAADGYSVSTATPGGYSLHGDWINGWHPEAMQALIEGCIQAALDCHDGNLANGFRLSGTAAGVQQAQPIINQGLGSGSAHGESTNYSYTYWNPDQPGWGLQLTHQGDLLFGTWYTYAEDGLPMFLTVEAQRQEDGSFAGPIFRTAGTPFAQINGSAAFTAVTQVGEAALVFDHTSILSFHYQIGGVSQLRSLQRFIFDSAAPVCIGTSGTRAAADNYSDLWWNESEPGWGLSLAHQGDAIVLLWYTYGAAGRDQWFSGSVLSKQADGSFSGPLQQPASGTPLAQIVAAATDFPLPPRGQASLRFSDGESGIFEYEVDGVSQAKVISRFVAVAQGQLLPLCTGGVNPPNALEHD